MYFPFLSPESVEFGVSWSTVAALCNIFGTGTFWQPKDGCRYNPLNITAELKGRGSWKKIHPGEHFVNKSLKASYIMLLSLSEDSGYPSESIAVVWISLPLVGWRLDGIRGYLGIIFLNNLRINARNVSLHSAQLTFGADVAIILASESGGDVLLWNPQYYLGRQILARIPSLAGLACCVMLRDADEIGLQGRYLVVLKLNLQLTFKGVGLTFTGVALTLKIVASPKVPVKYGSSTKAYKCDVKISLPQGIEAGSYDMLVPSVRQDGGDKYVKHGSLGGTQAYTSRLQFFTGGRSFDVRFMWRNAKWEKHVGTACNNKRYRLKDRRMGREELEPAKLQHVHRAVGNNGHVVPNVRQTRWYRSRKPE
ncbi:hypothetical protein DFH06DRAFT_1133721 [Mycena polygramma]|nr:hypothetical protein DFH06DRAFT_1133721 [Mycena polygramma]